MRMSIVIHRLEDSFVAPACRYNYSAAKLQVVATLDLMFGTRDCRCIDDLGLKNSAAV